MSAPTATRADHLGPAQADVLAVLAPGGVLSTAQLGRWAGLRNRRVRVAARRLASLGLIYGRRTGGGVVLWQITPTGRDIWNERAGKSNNVASHKD